MTIGRQGTNFPSILSPIAPSPPIHAMQIVRVWHVA